MLEKEIGASVKEIFRILFAAFAVFVIISAFSYMESDISWFTTSVNNPINKNFDGMDTETLAGLFINKLGFLPKVGDKIEIDNMILAVTAADKRKVKKIGITIKTNS